MSKMREPLEAQLIASFIDSPEFSTVVPLDPDDFVDPRNGRLFRAIKEVKDKLDVTPLTIADKMEELGYDFDADYFENVIALTPTDITIDTITGRAAKIRENRIRIKAESRLRAAVLSLSDPSRDIQSTLDTVYHIVTDASTSILGQKNPTGAAIIDRLYHQKTNQVRFTSGLKTIDASLTAKGMRQGHVWTIVAPYKGYKTTVVLNIVANLLQNGQSVSYIALEDYDGAFTEVLTAVHSGVPLGLIESVHLKEPVLPADNAKVAAMQNTEHWIKNVVDSRWRVYDASYGIHDYRRFPTLVASDKMLYNTDVVVVDYLQAWSEDREQLENIAQMLVEIAASRQVCIIALSQMSSESIRYGTSAKEIGTKNSNAFGAATHVGIEIKYDPEKSVTRLTSDMLNDINANNVGHFLSLSNGPSILNSATGQLMPGASEVVELGLWLKVVRRGRVGRQFVLMDRVSGKILLQYPDVPRVMQNWATQ